MWLTLKTRYADARARFRAIGVYSACAKILMYSIVTYVTYVYQTQLTLFYLVAVMFSAIDVPGT